MKLCGKAAGNTVSFVDPTGNNALIVDAILGGVKAVTMAISYITMKADQYFNHLPSSDVARQNADFRTDSNIVGVAAVGQIGGYALATPSGLNATLTVATNPTLFERGRDFASGFIEGLTSEATHLPNLSPSEWRASQVGEFFGNSIREAGTNIFGASLHCSSSQMLNLQNLPAFTVEPQNLEIFNEKAWSFDSLDCLFIDFSHRIRSISIDWMCLHFPKCLAMYPHICFWACFNCVVFSHRDIFKFKKINKKFCSFRNCLKPI